MRKCHVCGSTIYEDTNRCPVCGSKINQNEKRVVQVEEKKVKREYSKFTKKEIIRIGIAIAVLGGLMVDLFDTYVDEPIDMEVYTVEWQSESFDELNMKSEDFATEVSPYRDQLMNFALDQHIEETFTETYMLYDNNFERADLSVDMKMGDYNVDVSIFQRVNERSWYLQMEIKALKNLLKLPEQFTEVFASLSHQSVNELNAILKDYAMHYQPDKANQVLALGNESIDVCYIEENPRFTQADGVFSVSIELN